MPGKTANKPLRGKRYHESNSDWESDWETSDETCTTTDKEFNTLHRTKRQRLSHVLVPNLLYPKALYAGHKCPEPVPEKTAVKDLLERFGDEDEKYIQLSDFCIYSPRVVRQAGTLVPLNDLLTRFGNNIYLFSGTLRVGCTQYYVEDVPFDIVSVEGYEENHVSVQDGIYIQSRHLQESDVWYKLCQPAEEYACYYQSYLWLADFCKHFVAYILAHDKTTLYDFKSHFHSWIKKCHGHQPVFQQWFDAYGRQDFRTVIASHYEYLWKESSSFVGRDGYKICRQHLWKEVDHKQLTAVPKQLCDLDAKTVVTPYVYELFKHMYFGDQLEFMDHRDSEENHSINGIPEDNASRTTAADTTRSMLSNGKVSVGDVVCVERDEAGHWRDTASTWYAYVHDIEETVDGFKQLHVFWLYRPSDTACGTMRYPYSNELFFSDHCNCHCSKSARVYSHDISARLIVQFTTTPPKDSNNYFIRQTYIQNDYRNSFVTFNKSHQNCEHRTRGPPVPSPHGNYEVGSTVLVQRAGSVLEPVAILKFSSDGKTATVREFLRKGRDLDVEGASLNELVYTTKVTTIGCKSIKRACYIRCYNDTDVRRQMVPAPYNLNGAGDYWIVTEQLTQSGALEPCRLPLDFKEGFNPKESAEKLQILDLFCGSGSLGRGIEAGGAAEVKWAVDIDRFAIHTKNANLDNQDTALFYGSAVDYFVRAASGRFSHLIAKPAAVGMIIAGSPCQGFSNLQQDAGSARSRRNASMVALLVAFIDLYRPKYALLENVFGMMRKFGPEKNEDVFAQVVCALVGMGYQCRYFLIDAFSQGSPQLRTRIFISIAAPGLTPIECPPVTHSGPRTASARSIGTSLAGVKFGSRQDDTTPFPYLSAAEATKDLPPIGSAMSGPCIPFPDHKVARTMNITHRLLVQRISRFPYGRGFWKSLDRIPRLLYGTFENRVTAQNIVSTKTWGRVTPNGLFGTITTAPNPADTKNGMWLHWDEHRMVSLMEARRAQSFPDDMILVGQTSQQWKLVGNAVSYNVAAALGLSLRKARMKDGALTPRQVVSQSTQTHKPAVVVISGESKNIIHAKDAVVTILRKEVIRIQPTAPEETAHNGSRARIQHRALKLVREIDDSDETENESEDPLTSARTLVPVRSGYSTPASSTTTNATTLSEQDLAQAVAGGNPFAQYMVIDD